MTTPPETSREDVVETLHGDEIADPYRWLEADGDDAVDEWTAEQNEYADTFLHGPTRELLRPEFEPLAAVQSFYPVVVRGGCYFQRVEAADEDHPVLYVRESLDDDRRMLVDPNVWPVERSLVWYAPSHDGRYVAYGASEGGDEQYDIVVLDVETGDEVDAVYDAGRTGPNMLSWATDGGGFYYVATGTAEEGKQMDKEVRYHPLRRDGDADGTEGDDAVGGDHGTTPADDGDRVLLEHDDPHVWPLLVTDDETGTLVLALSEMSGGTDVYVYDEATCDFEPALVGWDVEFTPVARDGYLYLRTEYDAPRGQVLGCAVDRLGSGELSPDDLDVVIPERDGTLEGLAVTPTRLVANHQRDAHSHLTVFDREATVERSIDLPEYGTVEALTGNPDGEECFYVMAGFDRPATVVRADLEAGGTAELSRQDVDVDVDLTVTQRWVDSTDGAAVPVFVTHRSDVDLDGDNPAILYGYGGFRISLTPSFSRFRLPFFRDGGVFAQVCARGGREFGEEWHQQGMLAAKQHTFDDFVAAAEMLVEEGYSNPDRLAVAGGSNGGLSVGAVITQRPDLFGAALCHVPLLDMLRFHRLLLGESWTTEYGHPEDPDAFAVLREYSPYHNVEADVEYPPVYFTTAEGDTRVHPAHARKMVARMQAEADGGPFLLRTKADTGHGVGKPTSMILDEQLDEWTFVYEQLGVDA